MQRNSNDPALLSFLRVSARYLGVAGDPVTTNRRYSRAPVEPGVPGFTTRAT